MSLWHSLYLPSGDAPEAIATACIAHLESQGYTRYDPFGLSLGGAYDAVVKGFVWPLADSGWQRVLFASESTDEPDLLTSLAADRTVLSAKLDGSDADVQVAAGDSLGDFSVLLPHTHPGVTITDLEAALSLAVQPQPAEQKPVVAVPLDALQDELGDMADQLDARQTEKMFTKLAKRFMPKDQQQAAQDLLSANTVEWGSVGGQRLAAFMACLTIPESWRDPDYTTLRDAYALHRRKQKFPNATLYPGDAEALAAVPDALQAAPIFAGKKA